MKLASYLSGTILAVSALTAPAALANSGMIDATSPEKILNLARGYGSATLETDSSNDPFITGRIDGIKYGIYFYGCTNNKDCDDIQFTATWSSDRVSMSDINGWNSSKRYGKAYLDSDNDPALIMTVNLDYGVSYKNLDDSFMWWSRTVKSFRDTIVNK